MKTASIIFFIWMSVAGSYAQSKNVNFYDSEVNKSSLFTNWFYQAGIDVTLQNPYNSNFLNTCPKGMTYGVNMAIGKYFAPEISAKLRVNWDNWLIENNDLEWVAPMGRNGENYSKGGFGDVVFETHFNVQSIFFGYKKERKWVLTIYPRMGLVSNFAIGSCSPLIGFGIENTIKIDKSHWFYVDIAYQMTTSEFAKGNINTGTGTGSNGFMNIDVGIGINLGKQEY